MIDSQAAQWLLEDHPEQTVEAFWRHVDTDSTLPFWAIDPEWRGLRSTGCLAAMGNGRRCSGFTSDAPFCARHLKSVRKWFRMLDLRDEVRDASPIPISEIRSTLLTARHIVNNHLDDLVYFWEIEGSGLVKIGHSNRVHVRTAVFLTGKGCTFPPNVDPSKGRLLGTAPGGRSLEAALHVKYARLRVRGEWFRLDEELATEIDSFINQPAKAA